MTPPRNAALDVYRAVGFTGDGVTVHEAADWCGRKLQQLARLYQIWLDGDPEGGPSARATLLQIGAALVDRDTRSGCRIEPGCAVAPEGSDVACQSCWETQRRIGDTEEQP